MRGIGPVVAAETTAVSDRVRDVMVLTVPRLAIDELEPMVEPDPWMPDDGCAKRFAKAFIFDETPRMTVRDEVYDLMCLADPLVAELSLESHWEDADVPEDGAELRWAEELFREPEPEPEVPFEVPEAACAGFAALMATTHGYEEQPDWSSVGSAVCPSGNVWDVPMDDGAFDIPEDAGFILDYVGMGLLAMPEPVVRGIGLLAPPQGALMLPAPVLPESIPAKIEIPEAVSDPSVQSEDEAVPMENTPRVMFTFGPQRVPEGGWRVSFSF